MIDLLNFQPSLIDTFVCLLTVANLSKIFSKLKNDISVNTQLLMILSRILYNLSFLLARNSDACDLLKFFLGAPEILGLTFTRTFKLVFDEKV